MMRRYEMTLEDDYFVLVTGNDREARSLYRNLYRHGHDPIFAGEPVFRPGGMYGIIIDRNGYYLINADSVVRFLTKYA